MNNSQGGPGRKNGLIVWTCLWAIAAVCLRLYTWRTSTWWPGGYSGGYSPWLLALRSLSLTAALGGAALLRLLRA